LVQINSWRNPQGPTTLEYGEILFNAWQYQNPEISLEPKALTKIAKAANDP